MNESYDDVAKDMEEYLVKIKEEFKKNPELARRKAFTSLIETGVFINDACMYCPNHPRNGGSGICYCALGTQTLY